MTTRREMIKKTAVGGAVAGVAWSAPRIEGLSLRPDYAAAHVSSAMGDFFFEARFGSAFVASSTNAIPHGAGGTTGMIPIGFVGSSCNVNATHQGSAVPVTNLSCAFNNTNGNWGANWSVSVDGVEMRLDLND